MSFRSEGDKVPTEPMIRYTISSADLSAKKLAEAARQHGYIENKLHGSLDVALREDACKIHRGYAAENLARERHIALNYLKGETNFKSGIRRKQKKAALDENYLANHRSRGMKCFMRFPWGMGGRPRLPRESG
jgi:hypothetical protein